MDLRILRDRPATIEATFRDLDGDAVDAGNVTVTITRDDGTAIVTDAATTKDGTPPTYSYDLTADDTDELDRLTAVWTSDAGEGSITTLIEVVGRRYATLTDVRDLPGIDDEGRFPDSRLREALAEVETRIEVATGRAWVPRYGAETHGGSGRTKLLLARTTARRLLSATEDGTAVTFSGWTIHDGYVHRDSGSFSTAKIHRIAYEHGQDAPPADLRRAALAAIRYLLLGEGGGLSGSVPSRATSLDTEFGSYRLQMADTDQRPFGHDQIDSVIMRHADDSLVFASDTLLNMTPLG